MTDDDVEVGCEFYPSVETEEGIFVFTRPGATISLRMGHNSAAAEDAALLVSNLQTLWQQAIDRIIQGGKE